MSKSIPILRFTYAYECPGSILENETIEIEETDEQRAHASARAKLDRHGLAKVGLRLVDAEETGTRRSA